MKPTIKLVFDKVNNRVLLEDDSKNAFYTDEFIKDSDFECSDEVVEKVVKMFNSGKKLMDIDYYLLDEGQCTQDAREVIVEGLYLIYNPNE